MIGTIGIIQIGNSMVGPLTMDKLARNGLGKTIVLINNHEDFAAQHALDIQNSYGKDNISVVGGIEYDLLEGAEIVILTGSVSRIPNMLVDDYGAINQNVFGEVSLQIHKLGLNASVILAPFGVSNEKALKEIWNAVNERLSSQLRTTISPPEKKGELWPLEVEGPFVVSERIKWVVENILKGMS